MVGLNCSVRIKKTNSKKRRSVGGKVKPINNIVYFCHFCSSENRKPGTPKAYVKTKMNELAARNTLSKLGQGVTNTPYSLRVCNIPNKKSLFSSKEIPNESPLSSGKKVKRKGWVSLKELTASTNALSPTLSDLKLATRAANSFEGSDMFHPSVLNNQFENVTSVGTVNKELEQKSILYNAETDGHARNGCVEYTLLESGESLQNNSTMKSDLEQNSVMDDAFKAGSTEGSVFLSKGSLENNTVMKLNLEQRSAMYDAVKACPTNNGCLEDIVLNCGGSLENNITMKLRLEQKPVMDIASKDGPVDDRSLEDNVLECGESLLNNSVIKLDTEQNSVMDDAFKAGSMEGLVLLSEGSLENNTVMKLNPEQRSAIYDAVKACPTGNGCLEDIVFNCGGSLENNLTMKFLEQKPVMDIASKDGPMGDRCLEDNVLECGLQRPINSEQETVRLLKDANVQTLENVNDSMIEEKQLSNSYQKQPGRGQKHTKQQRYKSLVASYCSLKQQCLVIHRLRTEIHHLSNKMTELTQVVDQLANRLNESASPGPNVNPDMTGKSMQKAEDVRGRISPKYENGVFSGKDSEALRIVNGEEAMFPSAKTMHLEDLGGAEVLNSLQIRDCDPNANSDRYEARVRRERVICKSILNPFSGFEDGRKCMNENSNGGTLKLRKSKSVSRKIPVFRRYGRRWFAVCKTYRKLKWRIV